MSTSPGSVCSTASMLCSDEGCCVDSPVDSSADAVGVGDGVLPVVFALEAAPDGCGVTTVPVGGGVVGLGDGGTTGLVTVALVGVVVGLLPILFVALRRTS